MESVAPTSARDQSVDVARGVAIVAIVLGHVERGLASASLLPLETALGIDRLLYLFHLATFAYLSGLFVKRAVERDGTRQMLTRRVTLFVWLYLLWTVIQGTVRVAASSVANTPVTVGDVARAWIPEGQLWFLPWLIGVTVVAATTQPWRSRARAAVVLGLAGLLAVAVWGFDPLYAFTRGWALLFPFLIGCVVTQSGHAALARRRGVVVAGAVVGTTVWLWVGLASVPTTPTTGGGSRTVDSILLGVLGCGAGTVATLAVAALLARTPVAGPVALVGRRSLEIFLAHIVVASGTRIVLVQLGVADPWVHLVAGTTLGVVVPVVLAVGAERLGWTWLFGLPRRLHRAVA
ncbi:acyltransferase [Nocardioides renjunii]|uniref:acyltransferase n=1 Tax=Nocardioides renjunii TaxID=3095075 RepID=UPI002AFFC8CA|nr:acyltransferase [Nocardioides sp. S-34]WQQ21780.1 acyltransferase [Nocardioides sp. S-34]